MADTEHLIRERAYLLWEQDGRPDGRDLEYWERARSLVHAPANGYGGEANGSHVPTPPPAAPSEPVDAGGKPDNSAARATEGVRKSASSAPKGGKTRAKKPKQSKNRRS